MASTTTSPPRPTGPGDRELPAPSLVPGEHLDQKTFHARYEAMPKPVRAELIGGIVIMPSPMKKRHGKSQTWLSRWLSEYQTATPGTETCGNASTILGDDSEPQPDGSLLIEPQCGGQTREDDDYIIGAPELMAEVASATESYDLHSKKGDYERAGVREYVVVALRQQRVIWFVLRNGKFEIIPPGPDGILRSEVFPGLWLDPAALLRGDVTRLKAVLDQGLATPEHAAFVAKLAGK